RKAVTANRIDRASEEEGQDTASGPKRVRGGSPLLLGRRGGSSSSLFHFPHNFRPDVARRARAARLLRRGGRHRRPTGGARRVTAAGRGGNLLRAVPEDRALPEDRRNAEKVTRQG